MPLYVVATPIGNPDDLSPRARQVLESADLWVVEEPKVGRRFAKSLGLQKEMMPLNEHNEAAEAAQVLQSLLEGQNLALISDCGTPLFADPGAKLVELCHQNGVQVIPVPGAASLTAALSVSGLLLTEFLFAGFLPRSSPERRAVITSWLPLKRAVVVMDTPYRIAALVQDLLQELGPVQGVRVFFSLTQPEEEIFVGNLAELTTFLGPEPPRREFVMILEAAPSKREPKPARVKTRKRR